MNQYSESITSAQQKCSADNRHEARVAEFNRVFGEKCGWVPVGALAQYYACSQRTILRNFAPYIVKKPGGLRIARHIVIQNL